MSAAVALADAWVKLVQAIVWPFTVFVIALLFRQEIPRLIERIGGRVSRVSIASVSLDLAVASEIPPSIWQSLSDLQETKAVPQAPDSGSSLFRLIQGGEKANYVKIDLGEGQRWITSRLFIFALIPFQILGVRTLVFLVTRDGVPGRFEGLADTPQELGPSKSDATKVREERAEWIKNAADLGTILGDELIQSAVVEAGPMSRTELYRQALSQWNSEFVAVVDGTGFFKQLLDRRSMLARLAADQVDRQTPQAYRGAA